MLSAPDFSKGYILQVDVSGYVVGAGVSQIDELGEEHPIACASVMYVPLSYSG